MATLFRSPDPLCPRSGGGKPTQKVDVRVGQRLPALVAEAGINGMQQYRHEVPVADKERQRSTLAQDVVQGGMGTTKHLCARLAAGRAQVGIVKGLPDDLFPVGDRIGCQDTLSDRLTIRANPWRPSASEAVGKYGIVYAFPVAAAPAESGNATALSPVRRSSTAATSASEATACPWVAINTTRKNRARRVNAYLRRSAIHALVDVPPSALEKRHSNRPAQVRRLR